MHSDGWWQMGGMWIIWLLVLLAVVLVVQRAVAGRGRSPDAEKSAEQVLKERYARGEIEKEEYEGRLRDLRR